VPINKLPLLDWTSLSAKYGATYDWTYVPLTIVDRTVNNIDKKDTINQGNIIKNSSNLQLNANANLSSIYNKIGFIKDLMDDGKGKKKEKPKKTVVFEQTFFKLKDGVPKSISHKLGTQDVKVTLKDADGKEVKGKLEIISGNRVKFTPDRDVTNATVTVEGKVDAPEDILFLLAKGTVKILTGIKSVSGTYSLVRGTTLPGYTTGTNSRKEAQFFGSSMFHGSITPGIPFILGNQQNGYSLITNYGGRGLLTKDSTFNSLVLTSSSTTINLRLDYEPFQGLKVDLNANHSYSENNSWGYNNHDPNNKNIPSPLPATSGNFSMSIISFKSMESLVASSGFFSKVFQSFQGNRKTIQKRLNQQAIANVPDYYNYVKPDSGFTINSQQVLIPAFLGTYGGYGVNNVPLNLFPGFQFIRPNWRVTYDGLTNIPIVQEYFRSITFSHVYSSTYNIGSFASNLGYYRSAAVVVGNDDYYYIHDLLNNWLPQYAVSAVIITEQFSPLIGVDMAWKNNLTTRFEYKKNRSLSLSLSNNALSEMDVKEYVVGAGYKIEQVPLIFTTLTGAQSTVKSNINLRMDVTLRDDVTLLRTLNGNQTDPPQAGNWNLKISLSADYALSDKLNVRVFYDRLQNDPRIGSSFNTTNTNAGFSIRFTLAQ
jgi:cell surface protein SprA